jgi:hypothetical protein
MPQKSGSAGKGPGKSIYFEDGSSRVMTPTDVLGGFGPSARPLGELPPEMVAILNQLEAGASRRGSPNRNDLQGLFGGGSAHPGAAVTQMGNVQVAPEAAPTPAAGIRAQPMTFLDWIRQQGGR